ncbi:V-set domain containing T-cell activation inhibitor 1-like isoform X2 [Gasterosteus aculeatus]
MKRIVGLVVLLALCLLITPAEDGNHAFISKRLLSKVGDNVTLECYHAPGLNVTDPSVYWKFNNSIPVLVFRSRGFSPDDQGEQFKGRASADSSWNPAEGNLSVKISSIERADAGTYTCFVGKKKMPCSTELSIGTNSGQNGALDGAPSPDPDDPGNPANNTGLTNEGIGVICLIIGIGIVIVSVIVIMIICKSRIPRIIYKQTSRDPPPPHPPSSLLQPRAGGASPAALTQHTAGKQKSSQNCDSIVRMQM